MPMSEVPESIKIKMLEDAGYHSAPVQLKYLKLVKFVLSVGHAELSDNEFNNFTIADFRKYIAGIDKLREVNLAVEARKILKEIGEL